MAADCFNVEVVYAMPARQTLLELSVCAATSIEQVIQQSGILDMFPEIDLTQQKVGIFGQILPLHHAVNAGDRIEIYRPLPKNPMDVRREKARHHNSGSARSNV